MRPKTMMAARDQGAIVFNKRRLILISVKKVASTTMAKILTNEEGIKPERAFFRTKVPVIPWGQISQYAGKGWTIFSIVRHPCDRMLSCWVQKVNSVDPIFCRALGIQPKLPFADFVQQMCQLPDQQLDLHVRPQWWYVTDGTGVNICDHIIKLENLAVDLLKLMPGVSLPHKNKTKAMSYRELWTPELLKLHRERFDCDFKNLGYV